jgi:hypothetical protein
VQTSEISETSTTQQGRYDPKLLKVALRDFGGGILRSSSRHATAMYGV